MAVCKNCGKPLDEKYAEKFDTCVACLERRCREAAQKPPARRDPLAAALTAAGVAVMLLTFLLLIMTTYYWDAELILLCILLGCTPGLILIGLGRVIALLHKIIEK